mmetsp:Transcript_1783/g.7410  ORF Transcript_1783/g.7410 Transcript_1783/m.7410 type:complete len:215 (+) Transcript_1783:3375-4019(+)
MLALIRVNQQADLTERSLDCLLAGVKPHVEMLVGVELETRQDPFNLGVPRRIGDIREKLLQEGLVVLELLDRGRGCRGCGGDAVARLAKDGVPLSRALLGDRRWFGCGRGCGFRDDRDVCGSEVGLLLGADDVDVISLPVRGVRNDRPVLAVQIRTSLEPAHLDHGPGVHERGNGGFGRRCSRGFLCGCCGRLHGGPGCLSVRHGLVSARELDV